MRRPARPSRLSPLSRLPRRALAFPAAAIALLLAATFCYDSAGRRSGPSAGQVLLDTRLVWARPSIAAKWPAVPGTRAVYFWDRDGRGYCEEVRMDDGRGERWSSELWGKQPCPPVGGDGKLFAASAPGDFGGGLLAYDLGRPLVPGKRSLSNTTYRQRQRAWDSSWPRFVASGMAYDDGMLYAGVSCGLFGPGVMALDGAGGNLVWWARAGASVVGPPAVGTLPGGGKMIVVAGECAGGGGKVQALEAATGRESWSFNLPFHPIAGPVVATGPAGGVVVVGGVGEQDRPAMAALDLPTGVLAWLFRSPRPEPSADATWDLNSAGNGSRAPPVFLGPFRRQPGGVAVAAGAADGAPGAPGAGPARGTAYFACGRRVYAVDLIDGTPRWELAPDIDATVVAAVNAVIDGRAPAISPAPPKPAPTAGGWVLASAAPANPADLDPRELPRAPWLTAPVLHGGEVLIGAPDGLRALAADDGRPLWHLRHPEVGVLDDPPVVRDGVAYVTGQGWVGSDIPLARARAAYAIRLDGLPTAPAVTPVPGPLRHWPWLAGVVAVVGVVMAGGAGAIVRRKERRLSAVGVTGATALAGSGSEGPKGPGVKDGKTRPVVSHKRRWPDALAAVCILAAAAVLVGWAARHPVPLPAPGSSGPPVDPGYRGPVPATTLGAVLGLIWVAVMLGVWRRQKLAIAAVLSLAVAAAVAALWLRGRRANESVGFAAYQLRTDRVLRRTFRLVSGRGGLRLETIRTDLPEATGVLSARDPKRFAWTRRSGSPSYPVLGRIVPATEQGTVRRWHGFEARRCATLDEIFGGVSYTTASLTAPAWSVLAPTALFPLAWCARAALRRRRRRRARGGRCRDCGYDLTGNVSGVCPECGTPVVGAPTAGAAFG